MANFVYLTQERLREIENEVKALKDQKDPEPKEDDGFLKFVADSRNWAYAYIENVQAGIWNFHSQSIFGGRTAAIVCGRRICWN